MKADVDLETYRESWEGDEELLLEALQSPHFTQLGPQEFTLEAYGFTRQHISAPQSLVADIFGGKSHPDMDS